jgi:hypothetical protein
VCCPPYLAFACRVRGLDVLVAVTGIVFTVPPIITEVEQARYKEKGMCVGFDLTTGPTQNFSFPSRCPPTRHTHERIQAYSWGSFKLFLLRVERGASVAMVCCAKRALFSGAERSAARLLLLFLLLCINVEVQSMNECMFV